MENLFPFWTGYLVVILEGKQKERLLNLALQQGIFFWDLHFEKGQAVFKVRVKDYWKLRTLVGRTDCRIKIKNKIGCPFLFIKGKRRKGFVLGFVIFAICLYLASSFVWFIDVSGNEEVKKEEILALLQDLEITPGTWKKTVETNYLADKLIMEFEEVAWASAGIRGTLLEIDIVEKVEPPEKEGAAADLVAEKDGLVVNILVLAGEPRVEEGDTVKRGDILIEGIEAVPPARPVGDDEVDEDDELQYRPIKARGIVEARVWYEGLAEKDLWETYTVPTGQVARSYNLRFNDKVVGRWGKKQSPYRNYQMEKIKRQWVWRNITLPVEVITLRYFEVEVKKRELTVEEALDKAEEEAWAMLENQLAPETLILRKHKDDRVFSDQVIRKISVETKENIALPKSKEEAAVESAVEE